MSVSTVPTHRSSSDLTRRRVGVAFALLAFIAAFGAVWGYSLGHFSLAMAVIVGWIIGPPIAIVAASVIMLLWTVLVERHN